MDARPDPDRLLQHLQADEASAGQGRLKLFFGASPGVGKTYTMLEAARQRKKEGWDVVIGVVETHGRAETLALVEGLEILPRKEIHYKNVALHELDVDGALARHPRLLLIDELAHTNVPGLRHAKRWQDVDEILQAGIDVYTTLNVQHWESLNDVVAQITGVVVRETVPDTFLQQAHDLELVDLPPDDLIKRLNEGKVYRGEMADRAADHFFKPGNLIALRELALRHAAERVDVQMRAFKERHAIQAVWSVGERLLVGVTANPMSARLVRATSRLATRLRAPWIAAHVETPAFLKLAPDERGRAIDHLRLAEKLGAETATLTGEDAAEELLAHARSHHVTRIIIGKPARPRWQEWLSGSVVNQLARRCGPIDLNIISGVGPDLSHRRGATAAPPTEGAALAWGTATVIASTLVCWPLSHTLDRVNLVMIYLIGVVWVAYRFGQRASFLASLLSVLFFDFFFVPPFFTFAVTDTQYILTFAIMLGVGFLISTITGRLRYQTETLRKREGRMRALYRLSRTLSETPTMGQMLKSARHHIEEFYRLPVLLLIADQGGDLQIGAGDAETFGWNDNEASVARWVFDKAQMAGAGSDTLSGAKGLYLPLKGKRGTSGVLAIRPADPTALMDPQQLLLLDTFASEIGAALESTRMSEAIGRAEMQLESQAVGRSAAKVHLRLRDILTEKLIVVFNERMETDTLLKTLLGKMRLPNPALAFQAIQERERLGSTLIGSTVAVPHARLHGLKTLQAVLGVFKKGPLYLLFVAPEEDPKIHLVFLAAVSAFFQQESYVHSIQQMNSPENIFRFIREKEIPLEAFGIK